MSVSWDDDVVSGPEQAGERGEESPQVYRESSGDAGLPGAGSPQPKRTTAPETGERLYLPVLYLLLMMSLNVVMCVCHAAPAD